ncbi:MAG: tetratricopeptide repeat protein [Candidatus Latescibacteria bacterium]|jgi:tetratricopeptide (TPR) repeat protein|nr:tetratricopeptide repeat protein [Candidatus Latescibacterota bacterium]MBT4141162.1 tetratricopeptide repeat protein [Candidatus Latescibacterota bacterium]MBT5830577.1 tetratricopeptide repeat protein [Candidatus Latescibacterota bacterium]
MTSKTRSSPLVLCGIILLGTLLRFYGLDWGTDHKTGTFHRFHTDESTLVESAQWVGVDMSEIRSSYGKAPMYLLWATAHILSPIAGTPAFELSDNVSAKFTHLTGRYISALLGTLLIYLVYQLGVAIGGTYTGLLAAFLMAVCPGHIQQSHYYTVDPLLTFWATLGLALLLKMPAKDWRLYIAFGIVCGLAAGTRFIGAWIGLPFLILHFFNYKPQRSIFSPPVNLTRSDTFKRVGTVIALGGIVLIACEPFIILDPNYYFAATDVRQFAASLQVARGEIVRVWTLYDFTTTPYLFYFTHLFRYGLGFPLELVGLLGLGLALVKRTQPAIILLTWFIAYLLLVGGLHTKPIRYATPVLPALVILGAWASVWLGQKLQQIGSQPLAPLIPILFVALPTGAYGIAFTTIYGQEDSRIIAQRWIHNNIRVNSHVLAANGGFPTAWMVPTDTYQRQVTDSNYFIVSDKWELYSQKVEFFLKRIKHAEWVILIEENRMKPFMAVPHKYPIGSEIYTRLHDEKLGFKRVKQFKNAPGFNLTTYDTSAEPTLTAFDHPTVIIYRRNHDPSPEDILNTWKQEVQNDPQFPDQNILAGVQAFKQQNWGEAKSAFQSALNVDPDFALAKLLIGEVYLKKDLPDSTQKIWDRAIAQNGNITKYAFIGMINTGLQEEGIIYLENIAKRPNADPNLIRLASQTYTEIGVQYQHQNDLQTALTNHTKALTLTPKEPGPYINAALILIKLGDLDNAQQLIDLVLKLEPDMPMALHVQAKLFQKREQLGAAYETLLKALSLDPDNTVHQNTLLEWGGQYYQQGKIEMAFTIFIALLEHNPNFQEAHYNLGVLYIQTENYGRALPALQSAVGLTPQDVDAQYALAGVYETLGQTDLAAEHYAYVLALQPNRTDAKTRLDFLLSQP